MTVTILVMLLAMPTLLGLFALKQATEPQRRPVRVSPRRSGWTPGVARVPAGGGNSESVYFNLP